MELTHNQTLHLLQMSTLELESWVRELAQENPVVELEEISSPAPQAAEGDVLRMRWLEENDYQNRYYQPREEDIDPIARVGYSGGLEETLERFLLRQLKGRALRPELEQMLGCLISCLDDNGYFRADLEKVARHTGTPLPLAQEALALLRGMEPAGVGAVDLSQCLQLQLERIGYEGPALAIVRDHLDQLARHQHRAIAAALAIPVSQVQQAELVIRELEPRPGALFEQSANQTVYIRPDIFVSEEEGRWTARIQPRERPYFVISDDYRQLLAQTDDSEVREYLSAKLQQAEQVLAALNLRQRALEQCAHAVTARQQAFFREGPTALVPLRAEELARELDMDVAALNRLLREKYLRCTHGLFPLRSFFSLSADQRSAVHTALRALVDSEDKAAPLSDQKLCDALNAAGHCISRRTVAKYREEMEIPSAFARRIKV